MNMSNIERLVKALLVEIGEDPDREGLVDTPKRVARAYKEMFRGYKPFDFTFTDFESAYDGIVARVGIPFFSYCEHHILSYSGRVHFGYIPNGRVVGASKIIRFVQHAAARLTIQEQLTEHIADTFMNVVKPQGCMVVLSASHRCEACRGVKVPDIPLVTQTIRGIFASDPTAKAEFLDIIRREWQ